MSKRVRRPAADSRSAVQGSKGAARTDAAGIRCLPLRQGGGEVVRRRAPATRRAAEALLVAKHDQDGALVEPIDRRGSERSASSEGEQASKLTQLPAPVGGAVGPPARTVETEPAFDGEPVAGEESGGPGAAPRRRRDRYSGARSRPAGRQAQRCVTAPLAGHAVGHQPRGVGGVPWRRFTRRRGARVRAPGAPDGRPGASTGRRCGCGARWR